MDDIILKYYKDNYYPTLEPLYKYLKKDNVNVTKKQVQAFLDKQTEQQITKETKVKKKDFGHITALFKNEMWQLDIFVLQKYIKHNKGYAYILTAVDVFTRQAY